MHVQALDAVQRQAEEANRQAAHWGGAAAALRSECASLEASMREQREAGELEVRPGGFGHATKSGFGFQCTRQLCRSTSAWPPAGSCQ